MAKTAAEIAQAELDKAANDVERKAKLLEQCEERFRQAEERRDQADQAVARAAEEYAASIKFADWLASHPALVEAFEAETTVAVAKVVEEKVEAEVNLGTASLEEIGEALGVVGTVTIDPQGLVANEVIGQTTVEEIIAEAEAEAVAPVADVEDLFATA